VPFDLEGESKRLAKDSLAKLTFGSVHLFHDMLQVTAVSILLPLLDNSMTLTWNFQRSCNNEISLKGDFELNNRMLTSVMRTMQSTAIEIATKLIVNE
jgi:ribosome-associated toxin RatA of RatAB toxin-antitoxin module